MSEREDSDSDVPEEFTSDQVLTSFFIFLESATTLSLLSENVALICVLLAGNTARRRDKKSSKRK